MIRALREENSGLCLLKFDILVGKF